MAVLLSIDKGAANYERKLQALCDETMEALLQRADALMDQALGEFIRR